MLIKKSPFKEWLRNKLLSLASLELTQMLWRNRFMCLFTSIQGLGCGSYFYWHKQYIYLYSIDKWWSEQFERNMTAVVFSHFIVVASSSINTLESRQSQGEHRFQAAGTVKSISSVCCSNCCTAACTLITQTPHMEELWFSHSQQHIVVFQLIKSI